ncbi:uncharacterized protein LOC126575149 [Anopheles aquasalis]|uniref:uncharacterized protein LOC126575149 n=1 Tax=Anopheles aquasalis TaxID=42839 RepID=UPI00215AEBE8|nr:uncharacterized protein LOC126575149 [Anopheles aquasalis]
MYNYQWPETPAPSVNQRNFPNPAAFLETPSLIGAIRGQPRAELKRPMRTENSASLDRFNTAHSTMNDSMLFDANAVKRPTPQTNREAPASKYAKHNVAAVNSKAENESPTGAAGSGNTGNGKQDPKATLRIVSGTIPHILKLIREQPKHPSMVLLETVANVLSVKAGTRPGEKIVLLRNHETGPILQAIFYEIDRQLLAPLNRGDLVRCVGRLQPFGSRFQLLKISRTSEQYERAMVRLQTVSAFVSKVMR